MRGDFRREFADELVMIFVHDSAKSATFGVYLLNLVFQFLDRLLQFDVFCACGAWRAIHCYASFRSENFRITSAPLAYACHDISIALQIKDESMNVVYVVLKLTIMYEQRVGVAAKMRPHNPLVSETPEGTLRFS
jgi:hypothetical protein